MILWALAAGVIVGPVLVTVAGATVAEAALVGAAAMLGVVAVLGESLENARSICPIRPSQSARRATAVRFPDVGRDQRNR